MFVGNNGGGVGDTKLLTCPVIAVPLIHTSLDKEKAVQWTAFSVLLSVVFFASAGCHFYFILEKSNKKLINCT